MHGYTKNRALWNDDEREKEGKYMLYMHAWIQKRVANTIEFKLSFIYSHTLQQICVNVHHNMCVNPWDPFEMKNTFACM